MKLPLLHLLGQFCSNALISKGFHCWLSANLNLYLILAPKPRSVVPLIERFHPNFEQAVEEEYVEADDTDNNVSNNAGSAELGQQNGLQSSPREGSNVEMEGSGENRENENDQSGSAESGDDSGDSGSGDISGDAIEEEQSGDQSSGESGAEDSGESGDEDNSGESADEESDDGGEDAEDEQHEFSQLRNSPSVQGAFFD